MRAMPRTWPSIRLKRLAQDALMSLRMRAIYPHRVSVATPRGTAHGERLEPLSTTDHPSAAADDALMHDHSHHAGARSPATSPPTPDGTIYTYPMHPQIRQVGPGVCPICGMALEPELAA